MESITRELRAYQIDYNILICNASYILKQGKVTQLLPEMQFYLVIDCFQAERLFCPRTLEHTHVHGIS